jgi:probable HAF family extracellular repeat protein
MLSFFWLKSVPHRPARSERSRHRPQVEPLEDRCVPSSYNVLDLGSGTAYDLNNVGQVVGTMGVLNWQTGTKAGPSGRGINDAGQVAGGSSQAYLWDPAAGYTNLGYLPGDTQSQANDLNGAGQVVGLSASVFFAGSYQDDSHAFLWDAANGMQSPGPFPDRTYSTATGINSAGQVVGWAQNSLNNGQYQYNRIGFFRDSTGATTLLGGMLGYPLSEALGINDLGQVVGSVGADQALPHSGMYAPAQGFVWQNGVATGLDVPAGYLHSEARAINNAGQVVALAYGSTYNYSVGHPFLWQNGVWTDLGYYYANSVNINDSGQILIAVPHSGAIPGESYLLSPVDPNAPASFAVTDFPSPTTAGAAGSFTVTALKADGTTAGDYTGTIHFTSSDPQAGLPSAYTFTTDDAGVHTFSAALRTAGTQSITATDTFGSITGTQGGIAVQAASFSQFVVAGFPSPITAGVPGTFTVTTEDAYGNTAGGYTGTIHFGSSDPQAVLPPDYTFTGNSVQSFSATLKTATTQSITATDLVMAGLTASQGGIVVNPAATSGLRITGPSRVTAGSLFRITVTAYDAYGNVTTGYLGTVAFKSSDASATLPVSYTFTASDRGVHTFTGLKLKKRGIQTVTVTDKFTGTLTDALSVSVS